MPRTARPDQSPAAPAYHVRNRGHNRERFFRDKADRAPFLRLRARFTVPLYHDCPRGNHFHLPVGCADPRALSAGKREGTVSTRAFLHERYGQSRSRKAKRSISRNSMRRYDIGKLSPMA
jgi:hypothetical protein